MANFRFAGWSLLLLAILALGPARLEAQSGSNRGSITGRVINAETGSPLSGAQVYLDGSKKGAVSDHQGYYRIPGVPVGSHTVVASYVGYERLERSVSVTPGRTVTENFELESVVIEGEAIVIEGTVRHGQAEALNRQKTSDNIQNVVSEELIETFPDPNVAEAVQRLPGITIQRDQGEGRYILVRGLEARLNTVSINGIKVPTTEGEIRHVAMDVIPSDLLSSIEVNKALTPDMDADAIGGSVNLRTKTARDYRGKVFKASMGSGYNDVVSDGIYQGSVTAGRTFGVNDKWGILFSGNYYKTNRGSQNNEFEFGYDDYGAGRDEYAIEEFQVRDYHVDRTRYGLSGTLDYQFHEKSNIFFTGLFSSFKDEEHRRRIVWVPDDGDFTSAYSAEDATIERELKDRDETQRLYNVIFGGDHTLQSDLRIDYKFAYSYGEEEEHDRRDANFVVEGVNMSWTRDQDFPIFSASNIDPNNTSLYEFDELVWENNLTTTSDVAALINFEKPFSWESGDGAFKFGTKITGTSKERENDARIYGWEGDEDLYLDGLDGTYTSSGLLDGRYSFGRSPDPDDIKSFFSRNRNGALELDEDDSRLDTDPANFEADEQVYAGYAQFKLDLGDYREHMLLFGARIEHTSLDYTGNEVFVDEEGDYAGTNTRSEENSYTDIFPMIHYRYRIDDNTNFRTAFTTSIARPNYYWLAPYAEINREDEEIEKGNPGLNPTKAISFDIMVEHYFRSMGIISAGFFYKNLDDYIYEFVFEQSGGNYDGYETTQFQNGESASLYGFEINWQQQLTMLPGAWNGLGLYANYTWTDSEAEFPEGHADATLPGQSEHSGNVAVSYDKYGFSSRFSVNFHGKYIDAVGETADEDEYYDNHVQLDLSLSQKLFDHYKLYADFMNLTDEPLRYYYGERSRPRQQEYYSFWTHFGIEYEF